MLPLEFLYNNVAFARVFCMRHTFQYEFYGDGLKRALFYDVLGIVVLYRKIHAKARFLMPRSDHHRMNFRVRVLHFESYFAEQSVTCCIMQ